MTVNVYPTGPIAAAGAFTSDISIAAGATIAMLASALEADRPALDSHAGMRQKIVPVRLDSNTGQLTCGGRYLFDTYENAVTYAAALEQFTAGGVRFWERPYFESSVRYVWRVAGAQDFKDITRCQQVVRFERWRAARTLEALEDAWPAVREAARARGLASICLLSSEDRRLVGLISTAEGTVADDPAFAASAALCALESSPSLGSLFLEGRESSKIFDRTSLILNIWLPLSRRAGGAPTASPCSPPLPRAAMDRGGPQ